MAKRYKGYHRMRFTYNGKRYEVYGHTKNECEEKKQAKLLEIKAGNVKRENPTLDQWYKAWTSTRKNVKDSTLKSEGAWYKKASKQLLDNGFMLGEMHVRDIKTVDIIKVQSSLEVAGLKNNSINTIIHHVSHVFSAAIDNEIIDRNPCKPVKALKITDTPARETIHRALTKKETAVFLEAASDSFYYDIFRFALNTGMRCGEISALYNSDIRDGKIYVDRTATEGIAGREIGQNTKTRSSKRVIPLNDTLKEIIAHQRKINRILDGDTLNINDTIFKSADRTLLSHGACNAEIKRLCKETGIEPFTMHAFRDTFATRALEAGIDPKVLQELLGHASFSMTMDLYGHVMDDTKTSAMSVLDKVNEGTEVISKQEKIKRII